MFYRVFRQAEMKVRYYRNDELRKRKLSAEIEMNR